MDEFRTSGLVCMQILTMRMSNVLSFNLDKKVTELW